MDLRERLERLRPNLNPDSSRATRPPGTASRDFPSIEDLVPGTVIETSYGPAFHSEETYPPTHRHGEIPLHFVHEVTSEGFAYLLGDGAPVDLARTVFLDTETTGLAGGSGIYIFLVGLGYFDGDGFTVRQYFLRDYSEEEAILDALAGFLSRFATVITFNGKVFDLPLLRTRYVFARRDFPLAAPVHLDLRFPARRLWGERLESCSLTSLEREILGHRRSGDVPGEEIPALYFDYLRTGDASPLVPVFDHNRHDVLALVALTGTMGRLLSGDPGPDLPALDLLSLGRIYEDHGVFDRSILCYELALEGGLTGPTRTKALQRLSLIHKRLRQDERAVEIWLSLVNRGGLVSLFPFIELAKYYEHRARDPHQALQVVERALEQALVRRQLAAGSFSNRPIHDPRQELSRMEPSRLDRDIADLRHRLERLWRKTTGPTESGV